MNKLLGVNLGGYTLIKFLGSGSFGTVYEGVLHNKHYALKIPIVTKERDGRDSILQEYKIYKKLPGIQVKLVRANDVDIMVMDLMGPSLGDFIEKYKRFDIKTTILLTIQLVKGLKEIHSKGYLHRDIKPKNIVIDPKSPSHVFLIDFGLACKYKKDFVDIHKFCGTERYASINAHNMKEQSRRDDLEAMMYTIVFLYKGRLPWQGIKNSDKIERNKLICQAKTNAIDLCKGMPKEFTILLKYIKSMEFNEKPMYSTIVRMMESLYNSSRFKDKLVQWA
jgi:serine/threonine protein kinase